MASTIAGWTPLNTHEYPQCEQISATCHRKIGGFNCSQACILTFRMSAGPEKVDPTKPANPPETNFTQKDVLENDFPYERKFLHCSYV